MPTSYKAIDDTPLFILKRDLSGGMNTRNRPEVIGDNQSVMLQNIFLETQGQASMRTGMKQVDPDFPYEDIVMNEDGTIVTNEDGIPITTDSVYITNEDGIIVRDDDGTRITQEE